MRPLPRHVASGRPDEELMTGIEISVPNTGNSNRRFVRFVASVPLKESPNARNSFNDPVLWHFAKRGDAGAVHPRIRVSPINHQPPRRRLGSRLTRTAFLHAL